MRRLYTPFLFLALALAARSSAFAQRAVVVVRHAEKISDADERLSAAGVVRAKRLAAMLEDAGVAAIYSTDTERTRGTAQPLADARRLPIQIYDVDGAKPDAGPFVARLRERHADEVVLVVGHSNTVPAILQALGCAEPVTIAPAEYDDLFVVVPKGNRTATLVRLRY